ncbi:MAG: sigma-70 family RNA polymerase sigma factor, partial [Clostridia bacterium]|nr:sigma-70 family RNA polymerase sigma factor [Clostridia bacterium]
MDFDAIVKTYGDLALKYIRFRLPNGADYEDVYQETLLSAYRNAGTLKNENAARAWLIQIAKNKCADWFRRRMKTMDIPLDQVCENRLSYGRTGKNVQDAVADAMDALSDCDRKILYLAYYRLMPQADIAKALNIPLGTVKSRLFSAKQRFRDAYPAKMKE